MSSTPALAMPASSRSFVTSPLSSSPNRSATIALALVAWHAAHPGTCTTLGDPGMSPHARHAYFEE